MKPEKLFQAMSDIDEKYILEAAPDEKDSTLPADESSVHPSDTIIPIWKRRSFRMISSVAAACLVLFVGVRIVQLQQSDRQLTSENSIPADAASDQATGAASDQADEAGADQVNGAREEQAEPGNAGQAYVAMAEQEAAGEAAQMSAAEANEAMAPMDAAAVSGSEKASGGAEDREAVEEESETESESESET